MTGLDLTPGQLSSASEFMLARRAVDGPKLSADAPRMIEIRWCDLVRLVAWYGALRYMAGRDGTGGTLE